MQRVQDEDVYEGQKAGGGEGALWKCSSTLGHAQTTWGASPRPMGGLPVQRVGGGVWLAATSTVRCAFTGNF